MAKNTYDDDDSDDFEYDSDDGMCYYCDEPITVAIGARSDFYDDDGNRCHKKCYKKHLEDNSEPMRYED